MDAVDDFILSDKQESGRAMSSLVTGSRALKYINTHPYNEMM